MSTLHLNIIELKITQPGHGLSVGDFVRLSGTLYVKAVATSEVNARIVGAIVEVDGDDIRVQSHGRCEAFTGLTPGALYYLSETTSGAIMTTTPIVVDRPVLIAVGPDEGYIIQFDREGVSLALDRIFSESQTFGLGTYNGAPVYFDVGTVRWELATDPNYPTGVREDDKVVYHGACNTAALLIPGTSYYWDPAGGTSTSDISRYRVGIAHGVNSLHVDIDQLNVPASAINILNPVVSGFVSPGDPVFYDVGASQWELSTVLSERPLGVYTGEFVCVSGIASGFPPLVPGTLYFWDSSGGITTSPVTRLMIGRAMTTSVILVNIKELQPIQEALILESQNFFGNPAPLAPLYFDVSVGSWRTATRYSPPPTAVRVSATSSSVCLFGKVTVASILGQITFFEHKIGFGYGTFSFIDIDPNQELPLASFGFLFDGLFLDFDRFTSAEGVWTSFPDTLAIERIRGQSFSILPEYVFRVGGYRPSDSAFVGNNDRFSDVTHTWSRRVEAAARAAGVSFALGNTYGFLLLGSSSIAFVPIASHQRFDVYLESYVLRASCPFLRNGASAFTDTIDIGFVVGDELRTSNALNRYANITDTWSLATSMPAPSRGLAGSFHIHNKLSYVVGGIVGGGPGAPSVLNRQYDHQVNGWFVKAPLSPPRSNLGAFAFQDNYGHALAGIGFATANDRYEETSDTWSSSTAVPAPARSFVNSSQL